MSQSKILDFPVTSSFDTFEGEPLDHFIKEDGATFAGRHVIIDLYGAERLTDKPLMERTFRECVEACGATLLHLHVHTFLPSGGLSGVAVLAESHISVHTWPEAGYAAFDVFMCGEAEPEKAVPILERAFGAKTVRFDTHRRGLDIADHVPGSESDQ